MGFLLQICSKRGKDGGLEGGVGMEGGTERISVFFIHFPRQSFSSLDFQPLARSLKDKNV